MDRTSDFLFARNSFWVGAGSAFDIWGDYFLYNGSRSGNEADARAIASDWRVVGKDIRRSGQELRRKAA
jgi:hypothetical protein